MSYRFVENEKINGPTRKLIRSHVMKGKNVGKIRSRPIGKARRQTCLTDQSCVPDLLGANSPKSPQCDATDIVSVSREFGDNFSHLTFSCHSAPDIKRLIHQCKDQNPSPYPSIYADLIQFYL